MRGRASFDMRMSKTPFDGIDRTTKFITLGWGSIVQRLFSTFPNHLPGVGLLLMRLSLGITLIDLAAAILLEQPPVANSLAPRIIGVVAGVFVVAGLWTPLTATLAAFDQFWIPLSYLHKKAASGFTSCWGYYAPAWRC
jgi:hypothetical protein